MSNPNVSQPSRDSLDSPCSGGVALPSLQQHLPEHGIGVDGTTCGSLMGSTKELKYLVYEILLYYLTRLVDSVKLD